MMEGGFFTDPRACEACGYHMHTPDCPAGGSRTFKPENLRQAAEEFIDGWQRMKPLYNGDLSICFTRVFEHGVIAVVRRTPPEVVWRFGAAPIEEECFMLPGDSDSIGPALIDAEASAMGLVEKLRPEPRNCRCPECGADSWRAKESHFAVQCKACDTDVSMQVLARMIRDQKQEGDDGR